MSISVSPLLFSPGFRQDDHPLSQLQPRISQPAAERRSSATESSTASTTSTPEHSDKSPASQPASRAYALNSTSQQTRVENSFSLQVQTREGDTVTVNFSQRQDSAYGSVNADYQQQDEQGSSALSLSAFNSQQSAQTGLAIEIEGELSEEEAGALQGLLDSVQSLSETFFAGDLSGAFEQAAQLGVDGQQLVALSLDVRQSVQQQTQLVSAHGVSGANTYQAIQDQLPPVLEALQAPIAAYADDLLAVLEQASPLAQAESTLQQLAEQLLPQESRLPLWQSFNQAISAAAGLTESTDNNFAETTQPDIA